MIHLFELFSQMLNSVDELSQQSVFAGDTHGPDGKAVSGGLLQLAGFVADISAQFVQVEGGDADR